MKLLVIEDQLELSRSICAYLKKDNFICEPAYNYNDAMERVKTRNYDCILLDISLPMSNGQMGNGLHILSELKELGKVDGVLIISAKNSLNDKLQGLNLGADDYLSKPFLLTARPNTCIRLPLNWAIRRRPLQQTQSQGQPLYPAHLCCWSMGKNEFF